MKTFIIIVSIFLCALMTYGQSSKSPKNVSRYCELLKKSDGTTKVKCSKLPIDLNGPRGEYEILAAVKDKKRFNLICKGELNKSKSDYIVLFTANKIKGKWKQGIGYDINVPNRIGKKQRIVECFFSDINTLFLDLEFDDSIKEAYLIRFTNEGIRWYNPLWDPYVESMSGIIERENLKILEESPRPKY